MVAAALVTLMVVSLGVVGVAASRSGLTGPPQRSDQTAATSTTSAPAPSTTSLSPTTVVPTTAPRPAISPVIPGWQSARNVTWGGRYDVPPEWTYQSGTIVGFQAKDEFLVTMSYPSFYNYQRCSDGSSKGSPAIVGLSTSKDALPPGATPQALAALTVLRWAHARNTNNDGKATPVAGQPTLFDVPGYGGAPTVHAATMTFSPIPDPYSCPAPQMRITAARANTGEKAVMVIILGDQGVPGALTQELENQILSTVRPS